MKRLIAFLSVLFALVVAFRVGIRVVSIKLTDRIRAEEEGRLRSEIARVRSEIYGDNYFHAKGISPEDDARLAAYDPLESGGSIVLSYTNCYGAPDQSFELRGDGSLTKTVNGESKLLATIPAARCRVLFHEVLGSGILNYSDAVIELKRDLQHPDRWVRSTHNPDIGLRISVPALGVETSISACAPQDEAESYPDIVEFGIFLRLEKEILSLSPEGVELWK